MKTDAHSWAAVRPAMLILLLLVPGRVWMQDLEAQWRNYLTVEAQVEAASAAESGWIEQQEKLGVEVRELQASRAFYNGWIIELLIARKSSLQVELADSLRQVQDTIARLKAQRADTFTALKKAYQQILLDADSQQRLTVPEKEQAITIGRRLMNRSNDVFDLPDYTSIIDSPYEHAALKRLVLADLQSVVQAKLVLIDSLLAEKETEVALLNRLNEFHRDLDYQLKSNLDLAGDRSLGVASLNAPDVAGLSAGTEFAVADRAVDIADKSLSNQPIPFDQYPVLPAEAGAQLGIDPFDGAIHRLEDKRRQYQLLLQRLQTELLQ
ncbi:MAG: hypothetical protein IIA59_11390 [Candidatus Marinimicrobia bacterium]|nr:hypothetical protein [Candidatus Neomarinimicrobiota bacterium]